jgi:hypothetical protein
VGNWQGITPEWETMMKNDEGSGIYIDIYADSHGSQKWVGPIVERTETANFSRSSLHTPQLQRPVQTCRHKDLEMPQQALEAYEG